MSGQDGARGYLLQAMICVLDSLSDHGWTSIEIEPNHESEKVDVIWNYPSRRKAVQVKHSTNRIGLPDATKWAEELLTSISADDYVLRLLGPIASSLPPESGRIGPVTVPIPEAVNISALRKNAAHDLDLYLTSTPSLPVLRPVVREIIVDALCNQFGGLSTTGAIFSRGDFDQILATWIREILVQGGHSLDSSKAANDRCGKLEALIHSSHGRRISRWQAAGLLREVAKTLSANEEIGKLPFELLPSEQSPLRLVVAPLGAGKSLAAERYFESTVRAALQSVESPIPVFLNAGSLNDTLEGAIRAASNGIGDPHSSGVCFVLDGLDDLSAHAAQLRLSEARTIVNAWPRTRALLTSRPMRCWSGIEEIVATNRLEEPESLRLVSISSSLDEADIRHASWHWSGVLKETIRVPLFALLLGRTLRSGSQMRQFSRAGLIAHLVECSIGDSFTDGESGAEVCRKLASECLDRGGGVPLNEFGHRSAIEHLHSAGLIEFADSMVSFPLPVLTQWFAAQALVHGDVSPESLWSYPGRVDRWLTAVAIAVGTGGQETADNLLTRIAKQDPGLLPAVVDEATMNWGLDKGVKPPDARDAASRLRNAMDSLISGLGDVAGVIAPINPNTGKSLPVGARIEREWLMAGWNQNADTDEFESLPPYVRPPAGGTIGSNVFPGPEGLLQFTYGSVRPHWVEVRGVRPGAQSAWEWRWVIEQLQTTLKNRLVPGSIFEVFARPLITESAWHASLTLLNRNRFWSEPISVKELESRLPCSLKALQERSSDFETTVVKVGWKKVDVTWLGLECANLESSGLAEIHPPLPLPDLPQDEIHKLSFPWQWYTEKRALERIGAVFRLSLAAYTQIVQQWFGTMAFRLDRAATLPARLSIDVDLQQKANGMMSDPLLMVTWEPLAKAATTQLVLRQKAVDFMVFESEVYSKLRDRLVQFRPDHAESLGTVIGHQRGSDLFSDYAVRNLVYEWLQDDLRSIHWI